MKSILFVATTVLAIMATAASSGTLSLSGTVALVNDIVITPDPAALNLNIVAGEVDKLIATVAETSNNPSGYKIFMKSTNASKLIHTVNPTEKAAYTISYDSGANKTLTIVDQQVKNVGSLPGLQTNNSNLTIKINDKPNAAAGTYTDTITISIAAN